MTDWYNMIHAMAVSKNDVIQWIPGSLPEDGTVSPRYKRDTNVEDQGDCANPHLPPEFVQYPRNFNCNQTLDTTLMVAASLILQVKQLSTSANKNPT